MNSGFLIENPHEFTDPLQRLLKLGFGLRKDAGIEEVEVDISAEEEAEEEEGEEEEQSNDGNVVIENVEDGEKETKEEL